MEERNSRRRVSRFAYFVQRRAYLVYVFLLINTLVFFSWKTSLGSSGQLFMQRHFLVSVGHLNAGYIWTPLTSAFSHLYDWHFLINMIVLFSFGGFIERLLGSRRFFAFYMAAAVTASLSHCLVSWSLLGGDTPALGASGALAGLVAVFALAFPRNKILLFGLIPIPAFWAFAGFVALDLVGLALQTSGYGASIGHGAHLGGAAFGVIYYLTRLRGRLRVIVAPSFE